MGRCGGWRIGVALLLAVVGASCGGTGEDPSDSGDPLVFETRGRLNLIVQPTDDLRTLILQATLLDPQGMPFENHAILFSAEFPDATFIPGSNNQGAVLTDNNGQAQITLVAGLTTGHMRVIAEAFNLNLAMGVTVELTEEGFVSLGPLGIIPAEVTFINPSVDPENPAMTIFNAVGGSPPYQWNNSNIDLGEIMPVDLPNIPNINERAEYTLRPIPTAQIAALQDTVTLLDAEGSQANALVTVVFAECALDVSVDTINFEGAVGGEEVQILITNGVPPFTVTQTFPGAVVAEPNNQESTVTVTVPTPPVPVDPNNLLIRDDRGCTATVNVTVTIEDLVITPASAMLSPGQQQQFVVTGGVPPYRVTPNGGMVDTEDEIIVEESGGSFIYTAGPAEGDFTILVIDDNDTTVEVPVSIRGLCGNGVLEGFEQCEVGGIFIDDVTCEDFGGTPDQLLICNDCTIDSRNCQSP